jgi:cold shock protein
VVTGIVEWYDDERGFGFIAPDDGSGDVFCHFSTIQDACYRSLTEGQRVEFDRFDVPEGLVAANVRRILDQAGVPLTVPAGDAVQVRAIAHRRPNLRAMAERLRAHGEVHEVTYLVRLRAPPHEMTLYDDGRAIVKGTADEVVAKRLVSQWLGVRIPD